MGDIKEIYEKYGNQSISANIHLLNITDEDKQQISQYLSPKQDYWKNFDLKELPYKLKSYFDTIQKQSQKIKRINVKVTKDKVPNTINIYSSFDHNTVFLSPLEYYYLIKPNSILGKINYALLDKRFEPGSAFFKEIEGSFGIRYNHPNNKKTYFLSNNIFFLDHCQLLSTMSTSKSTNEANRQTFGSILKLNLLYNLYSRSYNFKENLPFDPINRLSFQLSTKGINSQKVYEKNDVVNNIPDKDSQFRCKIAYENTHMSYNELSGSSFKLSSLLVKSLNSFYMKNKLFFRRIFDFDILRYQFNTEVGHIKSLNEKHSTQLKLNELFVIRNFRGVATPSRTNDGMSTYGNTSYAMIANKLFFKSFPLLNSFSLAKDGFEINPFVHCNMLYNPILNNPDDEYNSLHISSGLGLSVSTKYFCLEANYTPYVKKNNNEIHSKFSFTFGLD